MTVEELIESRTFQVTGKAAVVLSIVLNLALSSWIKSHAIKQFITDMDANNIIVTITSVFALVFLLIKIISAWYAFVEKIEDRIDSKKPVSGFVRFITGNRKKK